MSIWLCSASARSTGTAAPGRLDQRDTGFVAGGFDSQYKHPLEFR